MRFNPSVHLGGPAQPISVRPLVAVIGTFRAVWRRWRLPTLVTSGLRPASQTGFTLIELLIVVTMVVILASMGLVQYQNATQRTREAVLKEDLFRMRDAIDQYYADKNGYPAGLQDLVSGGYMREIPEDPMTRSRDTWQTTPAEPDPNNPSAQLGIYDVKSGSEALALDGTKYSDWD